MFVSDYTKPSRLLSRIRKAAGGEVDGQRTTIDGMLVAALSNDCSRVPDASCVSDTSFALSKTASADDMSAQGLMSIAVGDMHVVLSRDTKLIDVSRSVDSSALTSCDMACAMSLLSQSEVGGYVLLHYNEISMWNNQFVSKLDDAFSAYDGLPAECRSVVLDLNDGGIASLPYYKFRNMNEVDAYSQQNIEARISGASHVEFTEKLDGSMIQMRYIGNDATFRDGLLLSSSGSLSEDTSAHVRFGRDWVNEHPDEHYVDMCREHPDWTFVFEYVNPPLDTHVVSYDESRWDMYLTGIRSVIDGHLAYHDVISDIGEEYGINVSHLYASYGMDDVLAVCHDGTPFAQEGFVLNVDGFLVKLKLESFLGASRLVHSVSSFNVIIRNVAYGLMDDLIANVPNEYREHVMKTARALEGYDALMSRLVKQASEVAASKPTRKDSANYVNSDVPKFARGYVFEALSGKVHGTYLGRNIDGTSPHFMTQREFDACRSAAVAWNDTMNACTYM